MLQRLLCVPAELPSHNIACSPALLCCRDNLPAYRNALAHTLLSEGIPIILYGAEQVGSCRQAAS